MADDNAVLAVELNYIKETVTEIRQLLREQNGRIRDVEKIQAARTDLTADVKDLTARVGVLEQKETASGVNLGLFDRLITGAIGLAAGLVGAFVEQHH